MKSRRAACKMSLAVSSRSVSCPIRLCSTTVRLGPYRLIESLGTRTVFVKTLHTKSRVNLGQIAQPRRECGRERAVGVAPAPVATRRAGCVHPPFRAEVEHILERHDRRARDRGE